MPLLAKQCAEAFGGAKGFCSFFEFTDKKTPKFLKEHVTSWYPKGLLKSFFWFHLHNEKLQSIS